MKVRKTVVRRCEICGEAVKYLSRHIKTRHKISEQEYYDTYAKPGDEAGFCRICGKPLAFKGVLAGYGTYCSAHCEMQDPAVKNKMADTYEAKTGYRHNLKNPNVIAAIKEKQTEIYGGYGFQSKSITKKAVDTYNEKNGTEHKTILEVANANIDKRIETRRKHFDGKYFSEAGRAKLAESLKDAGVNKRRVALRYENTNGKYFYDSTIKKFEEDKIKYYAEKYGIKLVSYNKQTDECACFCDKCHKEYDSILNSVRSRILSGYTPCTNCLPFVHINSISEKEKRIADFIKENYDGKIILNDRSILDGKEIDIYLPEKNLAIEFDGLFWHNETRKSKNYHLQKTEECEKKGIQLIHIFEDEWDLQQGIVKSRILGLLGKNERIFARKCVCKTISNEICDDFLKKNHLQRKCVSKWRYGLFFQNELVSVMTFGKSRFKDEYELLRFVNKLNTNVIGGASKLLKHFMEEHFEIHKIVSFADRRWSTGKLYERLGMKFIQKTAPSYYYIIGQNRENRMKFQKHKLVAEGYDENKSEHEIMLERKIFRIYDCGNLKYELLR